MNSLRLSYHMIRRSEQYMSDYGASKQTISMDWSLSAKKRTLRRRVQNQINHSYVWRRQFEEGYVERYEFPICASRTHAGNIEHYLLWYHREPNMGMAEVQCVTTYYVAFDLKDKTVIYQSLQWLDYGV